MKVKIYHTKTSKKHTFSNGFQYTTDRIIKMSDISENHKKNISSAKQHITDETKRKISESKKGKTPNRDYKEWAKTRTKPILQYDLQGNFITKYSNTLEAAKKTGSNPSTISKVCRGIFSQTNGYRWEYE